MKKLIVINVIKKILKIKDKNFNLNLKINDIHQWDSLAQIQIYLELQKKLKNKIELSRLAKVRSVKDWIKLYS